MIIDKGLEEISRMQYPHKVDVVDGVMQRIDGVHVGVAKAKTIEWRKAGYFVAAAAVALVVLNVAMTNMRTYDDEGIGMMLAQTNDYSSWGSVEESAMNPIEFFYEE